jgi:phage FluMu protein Com
VHLLKDQSKEGTLTRCGVLVEKVEATVWYSDVDCPQCKPVVRKRRLVRVISTEQAV